jgi:hypothetical protein
MSDGRNEEGVTNEMYATRTSGTLPTGPVSNRTGRNFMPALPPKGKLAR